VAYLSLLILTLAPARANLTNNVPNLSCHHKRERGRGRERCLDICTYARTHTHPPSSRPFRLQASELRIKPRGIIRPSPFPLGLDSKRARVRTLLVAEVHVLPKLHTFLHVYSILCHISGSLGDPNATSDETKFHAPAPFRCHPMEPYAMPIPRSPVPWSDH
jgi:hypothetical protein